MTSFILVIEKSSVPSVFPNYKTCEVEWLLCALQMWAQEHGHRELDFEDGYYKLTSHAPQFGFSIYE